MRHLILSLILSAALLSIAGCNYHLRGTTQLPKELHTLILNSSDPYGPLTRAVRAQLKLSNVNIIEQGTRTDIPSLRISQVSESQSTVSIFGDGKTAEYQMVMNINAHVLLPGKDLYPLQVTVFRSFFDNPLTALAKDAEQEILRQEMREQAAQQLVRKLLTVQSDATDAKKVTTKQSPSTP